MLRKLICICILMGYTYLVFIPTEHTTYTRTQSTTISVVTNYDKEVECLAKHIYFEGRGESTKGQIAIGLVILNRLKHKSFPNTICEIISNYSWTTNAFSNNPPNNNSWKNIQQLANKLRKNNQMNNMYDITNNAIYYYPKYYTSNIQTKHLTYCITIGNNIFYK